MQTQTAIHALSETVPVLGVTLILCLFIGKISKKLGIPKVSGYIVLGIILGPGSTSFLSAEFVHSFSFFNELALGMILFNIGGEFNKTLIGKMKKEQILYSLLSVQLVFALVFLCFFGLSFLASDISMTTRFIISLFLALVSVESAPPTTLLVLKEYDAKGIVSQSIKIYLAFATITAVVGTLILTKVLEYLSIWKVAHSGSYLLAFEAFWNIAGSIIFGFIIGLLLSYFERFENRVGNLLFTVIASILLGQSIAHYLMVDGLLISLFIGFTLANASSAGDKLHETVKDMGGSIYALFFVLAGTHIDLIHMIQGIGILGGVYIVARMIGIVAGSYITSIILKIKDTNIRRYHGIGLFSHAGAALAIVQRVQTHQEQSAQDIFNIVVASIFVFEILGPILLKFALYKSKEIASWNPIEDKTSKHKLAISDILSDFKSNVTPNAKETTPKSQLELLIQKDTVAIAADANLESIKSFIADSHSLYPVVDSEHCYIGTLNINSIRRILEEDHEDNLIMAHSLIGESSFIPSNTSLKGAKEIFLMTQKEILPVVDPISRVLVGVISQKDILLKLSNDQKVLDER